MRCSSLLTRVALVAILAVAFALGTTGIAVAGDIYVDAFTGSDLLGDGSAVNPWASIGAAVATATAGDDIYVASGVYSENLMLKSDVDIYGDSAANTFVAASGPDSIFTASAVGTITIDGLAFVGGLTESGGAIESTGSAFTLSSCVFASNEATGAGGAIFASGSTISLDDCDFMDNESDQPGGAIHATSTLLDATFCDFESNKVRDSLNDGGAIYFNPDGYASASMTVTDSTFTGNSASDGGAVDIDDSADGPASTFTRCEFTGNWASDDAGSIQADDTTLTIDACTFTGESAADDAGAIEAEDVFLTITGSTFTSCTAGDDAGAVEADDSWGTITDSTFTNNTAAEWGGGLWFYDDAEFTVTGCTFAGNAAQTGGGVGVNFDDCSYSEVHIDDCDIYENNAQDDGGGIGLMWAGDDSREVTLTVTDSRIANNHAGEDGGGLAMDVFQDDDETWEFRAIVTSNTITGNTADDDAGAIDLYSEGAYETSVTVEGNYVANNSSAGDGGAAELTYDSSDLSTLWVRDNTFFENTATVDGGAIEYAIYGGDENGVFVTGNDFTDNAAGNDGGAVELEIDYCMDSWFELDGNTMSGNAASGNGGALSLWAYDPEQSSLQVWESTITANSAVGDGGGIWYMGEDDTSDFGTLITECAITDNTATRGGGIWAEDIYDANEIFDVTFCTISGNNATSDGGGVGFDYISDSYLTDNTIFGNTSGGIGGGVYATDSGDTMLEIADNTVYQNTSAQWGGGFGVRQSDLDVLNNDIYENAASTYGGGLGLNWVAATVDANTFTENTASNGGGSSSQTDFIMYTNNVYDRNQASMTGGGMYVIGDVRILNNTYNANSSGFLTGDGIYCDGGSPTAANNIFWDMPSHWDGLSVGNSLGLGAGPMNMWDGLDPFRDVAGGDFRLTAGSMAIDSGLATIPPSAVAAPGFDHDGMVRPMDGDGDMIAAWDLGAFEMAPPTAPIAVNDTFTVEEDGVLWPDPAGVLENDTDINGDELSAVPDTGPSSGLVAVLPNGSFVYEPVENWFGTDSFTYYASDGTSLSATPATVTIIVTPVNDPPVSMEDSATCNEDEYATLDVLANDSDPVEGDSLTATLTAMPASGTVDFSPSGEVTYTPDADFNGMDMFWYKAFDGTDYGDETTVTITVDPVNDAPVAIDDSYTGGTEDTWFWAPGIGALTNDTDIDSAPASLTVDLATITPPINAGWDMNANGTNMGYLPPADWNGTYTANYRIFDGVDYSNYATITIEIDPVNDAPDSSEDSTSCAEDTFATVDVLANDFDVDMDSLTAALTTGPANGSVEFAASGEATYTPNADWYGTDYFWYKASDGTTEGAVTTVTVTVTPVNDPPVANPDSYTTDEDTLLSAFGPDALLDNDTDTEANGIWWNDWTWPANGTLTPISPFGEFTYMPDPDWNGTDTFTYRAQEATTAGMLWSEWTTVTITVNPVNDAPVSIEDTYTVEEDGMLIVPAPGVIQNDIDVEDDMLTAELTSDAASGTLVFAETGALVYVPDNDWYGTEYCYYRIFDGELWSMESTIAITVTPSNDVPVSEDDTATCAEDTFATFNVLANDTDADPMDILTAQVWSDPDHGTIELSPSGDATYTPDADWFGNDTFVYRTFDGTVYSALSLVSVDVEPVNDAPIATDNEYETTESTTLTVTPGDGVLDDDSDVDRDAIESWIETPTASGVTSLAPDGSFTYRPNDGFWGTDTFTYVASDGTTDSAPAMVTITVNDVTPPTTTSDAVWNYNPMATITFEATDTASGVAATYYSLNGGPATMGTSVTTDVLGMHTLTFWSVDAAGNVEEANEASFEVEADDTAYETIAGANRYETAIKASQRSFPGTTSAVVIATGANWPDALGGSALAGVVDGPILLSTPGDLPGGVASEIVRLAATEAYVLGGEGALSAQVVTDLEALGLTVKRLGGADRYGTARLVAREVTDLQGASYDGTAFIGTGRAFADALAAGPAAAEMGWPIYLTRPDMLDDNTLTHMVDSNVDKVVVLGGPAAIDHEIFIKLTDGLGDGNVMRLSGMNRYQTAIAVAEWSVANTSLIWDGTALATGNLFPDALAAGPMQARLGSVLLLTPTDGLNEDVRTLLIGKREMIDEVRFIGGDAAIGVTVRYQVSEALR